MEPGDGREKTVVEGIPSFMAIAEWPGRTEAGVKAFMLKVPPPMSKIQLTTHVLDNLASYIMSLKGHAVAKMSKANNAKIGARCLD